jgi:DNA-binding MarR family transcriptional regulator
MCANYKDAEVEGDDAQAGVTVSTDIEPVTQKQLRAYRAIAAHIATHPAPPTHRELAKRLGITRNAASQKISALDRKGWITREPNKSRSIELTGPTTPEQYVKSD